MKHWDIGHLPISLQTCPQILLVNIVPGSKSILQCIDDYLLYHVSDSCQTQSFPVSIPAGEAGKFNNGGIAANITDASLKEVEFNPFSSLNFDSLSFSICGVFWLGRAFFQIILDLFF